MKKNRHKPVRKDKHVKKMELWKILAAVMAALVLMDAVMMIPIMLHAREAVTVPEDVLRISEELGAEYHLCPET
ncbi:MAG: hypothetical protein K2P25_02270, partial [Lachnospiraceae bacterium]|nr:hypothetical protein [Lachnospiraceae bacterium]